MHKKINLLITGGAGFIGSNLVEHFLDDSRVGLVRVLDNLSNGYYSNIEEFMTHPRFEFIEGDIRDLETCKRAMEGIHKVSHQAALGSVPRSIANPMLSIKVNVGDTVNIQYAAMEMEAERLEFAFSRSSYGDFPGLPQKENLEEKSLSPYTVTKAGVEQHTEVFGNTNGLNWIGFRCFNIFGPRQNSNNPYSAVIPIFAKALIHKKAIIINVDGETSRDINFVTNVVLANDLAIFSQNKESPNQVYNTACGDQVTLNEIVEMLKSTSSNVIEVKHGPEKAGNVRRSLVDILKITRILDYQPELRFRKGLEAVYNWYQSTSSFNNISLLTI